MFAKLKKKIEEESESGLVGSHQGSFANRSAKFPTSTATNSIPDLHCKSSQGKEVDRTKQSTNDGRTIEAKQIERQVSQNQSTQKQLTVAESKLRENSTEQESTDELQDFQKQEVAKIKHLLLISGNELKSCKILLEKRDNELKDSNEKLLSLSAKIEQLRNETDEKSKMFLKLESVVDKLTESNAQMIDQLEEKDQRIKRLIETEQSYHALQKEQSSSVESIKQDLISEKHLLIEEIDQMKKKNLETSSILEDKETTIQTLEERVKILEKRVNDNSLCDDEKIQSVIKERSHLEQLLDESRHHLSDIKLNWSEKINNLETQIAHLNKKMADDSEENQKLENDYVKLSEENKSFRSQCDTLQEENEMLQKIKLDYDGSKEEFQHCKTERNRLRNENEILNSNLRSLRIELNDFGERKKKDDAESKNRIDKLMGQQSEHLEKEIENESKVSNYESTIKKFKIELGSLENESSSLKDKLLIANEKYQKTLSEHSVLNEKLKEFNETSEENQSIIESLEVELDNVQQERDSLLMRNSELSQQSELAKQELNEEQANKERIQSEMQEMNSDLQRQVKELNLKMKSLEIAAVNNVDNSERVAELKTSVVDLESQLAEKNKVIKLQQQRLTDMKKTLQKELKVQQTLESDTVGDGLDISILGMNKISSKSYPKSSKNNNGVTPVNSQESVTLETINIQYLRHVVFKFMTSREYEALQLIKAISVLLKFTVEQENIIKETLDWKMSWFGHKPELRRAFKS